MSAFLVEADFVLTGAVGVSSAVREKEGREQKEEEKSGSHYYNFSYLKS